MERTNKAYAILMGLPEVQRLNLRLMEIASFNNFEGPKVVLSLLRHKDLWQACVMDREAYFDVAKINENKSPVCINLIKLRDMDDKTLERLGRQIWSVDTLFILPYFSKKSQDELFELAKTWKADEVDWITWPMAGNLLGGTLGAKLPLLRVWWD